MVRRTRILAGAVLAAALVVLSLIGHGAEPADGYVAQAAMADLFAIESARIAVERADSDGVREFARKAAEDHAEALRRLGEAAAASRPPIAVPDALDPARAELIARLRGAGADFDGLYLDLQMKASVAALALHRAYAKSGDAPALRTLADEATAVIQAHLEHLRMLAGATQPA
jgi:putative membrane protein